MNWANIATLSRIAMIPVVAAVYVSGAPNAYMIAAVLFAIASLTDWLDGYLARKLNQATDFGAFLDPVADKLLVAVVLILLVSSYNSIWFVVPCAIIIARELLVSALREWMASRGLRDKVAVNFLGKLKTTAQMLALIALLASDPQVQGILWRLGYGLLYTSAALSIWSMIEYFLGARASLSRSGIQASALESEKP